MTKRLYVGNLSYETTDTTLSELFGAIGEIVSVNVIADRMTNQPKGFAFVEMAENTVAQQAIDQLDGREVDGRSIKVAEARPRQDNQGGGRRDRW